jgi:nucleotide-binding universal stress UspA family protein
MPYRTLLLFLDDSPRCGTRAALAARLAREHEAHLIGVSPTGLVDMPLQVGAGLGGASDYIQLSSDYLQRRAHEIANAFEVQMRALELLSFESRTPQSELLPAMVPLARCSDLVVVGQTPPEQFGSAVARDFPQQLLLHAGRPLLIVPHAGRIETVGRKVLVAWTSSRETASAVAGALPMLQRARTVDVVCFAPNEDAANADRMQFDDNLRWMRRHGVSPDGRIEIGPSDAGEALLSRAADQSADLIVMGGYGHARLREFVLGGVTRTVLSSMTVPVLMSH